MSTSQITLLVPTLNRPDFVLRMAAYHQATGFRGCLMVGDSSDPARFEQARRGLARLNLDFQVVHLPMPGLKHFECLRRMAPMIQTPFATYVCDDDLLVTGALEEGIRFLEGNPAYSAASGAGILLDMETDGAWGQVAGTSPFPLKGLEQERSADRLVDFLADYFVVAFSVNRTGQFRRQWEASPEFTDSAFAIELFPCALIAAQGKVKAMNRLFVIRHLHRQRYPLSVAFAWMTGPTWAPSYHFFRERVAEELVRRDRIGLEEARAAVKKGFWAYLNRELNIKWEGQYQPIPARSGSGIREQLRRIPALRSLGRKSRLLLPSRRNRLSLGALTSAFSPYRADFLQVHEAVTRRPEPLREFSDVGQPGEPILQEARE